jgi:hypothetical protein
VADNTYVRLRYESSPDDEKLIAQGGGLFAATFGGFVFFALSAWIEGVHDVAFASDVGWSVFLGLVALLSGTRVYVRWRRGRQRRTVRPVSTSTARVVPRDEWRSQ